MARALKTYLTHLGFFELAIAAPSMKAAIEAWGVPANVFQQGFASQTDDPKIVKATLASPGKVLKRAVGSDDDFREKAALPSRLPNVSPVPVRAGKPKAKKAAKTRPGKKTDKAAVISFERERAKRAAQQEREDAKADKARVARKRAVEAAEADLAEAEAAHEKAMEQIEREREKLERRADLAVERWEAQKEKLEGAIEKAKQR